jgi:hypothetical protein
MEQGGAAGHAEGERRSERRMTAWTGEGRCATAKAPMAENSLLRRQGFLARGSWPPVRSYQPVPIHGIEKARLGYTCPARDREGALDRSDGDSPLLARARPCARSGGGRLVLCRRRLERLLGLAGGDRHDADGGGEHLGGALSRP